MRLTLCCLLLHWYVGPRKLSRGGFSSQGSQRADARSCVVGSCSFLFSERGDPTQVHGWRKAIRLVNQVKYVIKWLQMTKNDSDSHSVITL